MPRRSKNERWGGEGYVGGDGRGVRNDGGRGARPKRSLGQNFLTSTSIAAFIAEAATLTQRDVVVEIGPGKGMLTRELLARAGRVIAIEKDDALANELRETFAEEIRAGRVVLVHDDALALEPSALNLPAGTYKLIANIPYNITGALLRHWLTKPEQPQTMVLLVQKEVAERIVARDGKESILSISVKAYGTPRYLKTVKAGSFYPKPKVDSAVLMIENISRKRFANQEHEQHFFELVKAGFSQRRKLLASNVAPLLDQPAAALARCGLDARTRAESLSTADWRCLASGAT